MRFPKIFSIVLISLIVVFNPLAYVLAQTVESADYNPSIAKLFNNSNIQRDKQGVSLLATSTKLMRAAQLKAEDMAKNGYFAHTSPTGVNPWYWFYEAGYKPELAGENLALSRTLDSDIVKSWMNSEGHRKNIVNGAYTEMGIGIAKGKYAGRDAYYIVQLFGKPGAKN